tara:strand:+ start:2204 stop:2758 length:555 start_codon:yes stop_codon:yes gene_type:complete
MAIDSKGKPTTTGMMDTKPEVPAAPDLRALGQGQPQPQAEPTPQQQEPVSELKKQFPDASEMELTFAERVKSLTDEDTAALQSVLSPSVRTALSKIIPEFKEVMDAYGSEEPNVVIPLSTVKSFAMKRYGGENEEVAVQNFMTDIISQSMPEQPMEQQTTVPPSQPMAQQPQGIMTSPQNMEQV